MRNLYLSLALLILPVMAWTQGQADTTDLDLRSPYHTITVFLKNLREESFYPERAAGTLHAPEVSEEDRVRKAIELKQIFDGKGLLIDPANYSKNPDYKDSLDGKNILMLDQRIPWVYLEKIDERWLFSGETVGTIEAMHAEVFPIGTDRLMRLLAGSAGSKKFFGLGAWQILGILILVILSFLIHRLFTWLFEGLIVRLLIQAGQRVIAGRYIKPVARPFSLMVVAIIITMLLPALQLPVTISRYLILVLKASIPVFGTIVFYKLVDLLAAHFEKLAAKTESTLDDQLVPLLKRALKVFVVITGGLFTLQNLNFNITALLAGISIGGLAFALAAQDTLKNLFGSLMIFIDRPFQIGDWIISDKIDGSVEEVGFRSTRVRTFHNSITYVPNGKMADMTIDNMGMRQYRRYKTMIRIAYGTPADLIEVFIKGLERIVEEHPTTRKDYYNIYLNNFDSSALEILFYIFFAVPTWPEELKGRQEVMLSIVRLAEELGIHFALPTQTLHVETFPEKETLRPVFSGDKSVHERKMDGWFKRNSGASANQLN